MSRTRKSGAVAVVEWFRTAEPAEAAAILDIVTSEMRAKRPASPASKPRKATKPTAEKAHAGEVVG